MDSVTSAESGPFGGLGLALRWLRGRDGRHQFAVANAAGITKGMLSTYETGRQQPSVESLEKVLVALGADLGDLHRAIELVHGRPVQNAQQDRSDSPTRPVRLAEKVVDVLQDPDIFEALKDLLRRLGVLTYPEFTKGEKS